MSKTNNINKKIWIVASNKYHFVIAATSPKECKELIDEYAEEEITEKFTYKEIGNICPTLPYFEKWVGESFILISNFDNYGKY